MASHSRQRWALLSLPACLLFLSCQGGEAAAESSSETVFADPEAVPIVLPAGDPAAGRLAFLEHGCDACHRVTDDADFQTQSSDRAPELDPAALRAQGYGAVASSIIAPAHRSSALASPSDEATEMPLVNERLTVAEWIDLVHYLLAEADDTPNLVQ